MEDWPEGDGNLNRDSRAGISSMIDCNHVPGCSLGQRKELRKNEECHNNQRVLNLEILGRRRRVDSARHAKLQNGIMSANSTAFLKPAKSISAWHL